MDGNFVRGALDGARLGMAIGNMQDDVERQKKYDERMERRDQMDQQRFDLEMQNAQETSRWQQTQRQRANETWARQTQQWDEQEQDKLLNNLIAAQKTGNWKMAAQIGSEHADLLSKTPWGSSIVEKTKAYEAFKQDMADGKIDGSLDTFNTLFDDEINYGTKDGENKVASGIKLVENGKFKLWVKRFDADGNQMSEGWMTKDRNKTGAEGEALVFDLNQTMQAMMEKGAFYKSIDTGVAMKTGKTLEQHHQAELLEQEKLKAQARLINSQADYYSNKKGALATGGTKYNDSEADVLAAFNNELGALGESAPEEGTPEWHQLFNKVRLKQKEKGATDSEQKAREDWVLTKQKILDTGGTLEDAIKAADDGLKAYRERFGKSGALTTDEPQTGNDPNIAAALTAIKKGAPKEKVIERLVGKGYSEKQIANILAKEGVGDGK